MERENQGKQKSSRFSQYKVEENKLDMNLLVFSAKLNPSLCKIRFEEDRVIFAMACSQAIKLYSLELKSAIENQAELIFSSNSLNSGEIEDSSENFKYLSLEPITHHPNLVNQPHSIFLTEDSKDKILKEIWCQDLEIDGLDVHFYSDPLERRNLPLHNQKLIIFQKETLILHQTFPLSSNLGPYDGPGSRFQPKPSKIFYLNVDSLMRSRFEIENTSEAKNPLAGFNYLPRNPRRRPHHRINIGYFRARVNLFDGRDHWNQGSFSDEVYNSPLQRLLRATELPGVDFAQKLIVNDKISIFIKNLDLKIFIMIFHRRQRRILKQVVVDLNYLRPAHTFTAENKVKFRGLAWDIESDKAIILLSSYVENFWLRFTDFGVEERCQFQIYSTWNSGSMIDIGICLGRSDDHPIEEDIDKELRSCFLSPETGLVKKATFVHPNLASEILRLTNESFYQKSGESIKEELVLNYESGLSIVVSNSNLHLFSRSQELVYWRLPYRQ